MPAPYDMTLLQNQTSIIPIISAANSYTNNLMGIMFLLIIGIALFFVLRGDNRNREALVASAFTVMIVSILFTLLGLLDGLIVGACVFIFIGALVALIMRR